VNDASRLRSAVPRAIKLAVIMISNTASSADAVGEGFDRTRTAACSTLRSWSQSLRETRDAISPQLST
jgi:hypothetical protein